MRAHSLFTEAAEQTSGERAARMHLAAGSAAFQAQGWSSAADSFSQALVSSDAEVKQQAHYSLATSLFYLGTKQSKEAKIKAWRGSIEHYEQALELTPDDEKAQKNLELVRKYLKELQPEEEKKEEEKEESSDDQEKGDEDKSNDNEKSEDQEGDNPDDTSEQSDQKENESDNPEEKEDSPKGNGENEQDPKNPEENKEEGQDPGNNEEKSGDQNDPQENQDDSKEKNEQNSEEPENKEKSDKESSTANESESDLPPPDGESKEERARRLLRLKKIGNHSLP